MSIRDRINRAFLNATILVLETLSDLVVILRSWIGLIILGFVFSYYTGISFDRTTIIGELGSRIFGYVLFSVVFVVTWVFGEPIERGLERISQIRRDSINYKSILEGGHYFLYLRPFESTGKYDFFSASDCDTFVERLLMHKDRSVYGFKGDIEEAIEQELRGYGPLIAAGRPGEFIGAGRIELTEEMWQQDIKALMFESQAIVCIPSTSAGTLWEVALILNTPSLLAKTVFVCPPKSNERYTYFNKSDRLAWDEVRVSLPVTNYELPAATLEPFALHISPNIHGEVSNKFVLLDREDVGGSVARALRNVSAEIDASYVWADRLERLPSFLQDILALFGIIAFISAWFGLTIVLLWFWT